MFQRSTATQKLGKLDFRVNFRKKIQELDDNTLFCVLFLKDQPDFGAIYSLKMTIF